MRINITERIFWGVIICVLFTLFGLICEYGLIVEILLKATSIASIFAFLFLSLAGWAIVAFIYTLCGFIEFKKEKK